MVGGASKYYHRWKYRGTPLFVNPEFVLVQPCAGEVLDTFETATCTAPILSDTHAHRRSLEIAPIQKVEGNLLRDIRVTRDVSFG